MNFIKLFCFDINEYQQQIKPTYKNRRGKIRIDQVPISLTDIIEINEIDDYFKIIPIIENKFTFKDFVKITKLSKKATYIFSVIKYLELYHQVDRKGNTYIYETKKVVSKN